MGAVQSHIAHIIDLHTDHLQKKRMLIIRKNIEARMYGKDANTPEMREWEKNELSGGLRPAAPPRAPSTGKAHE